MSKLWGIPARVSPSMMFSRTTGTIAIVLFLFYQIYNPPLHIFFDKLPPAKDSSAIYVPGTGKLVKHVSLLEKILSIPDSSPPFLVAKGSWAFGFCLAVSTQLTLQPTTISTVILRDAWQPLVPFSTLLRTKFCHMDCDFNNVGRMQK